MLDNVRDHRSIGSTVFSAFIGPVIMVLFVIIIGQSLFQKIQESSYELQVIGAEHGFTLITYLEENGVIIVPGPIDAVSSVQSGDSNLVLIIPEDFNNQFSSGNPAPLQVVIDSSRQSAQADLVRVRTLLNSYNDYISFLRLYARGIDAQIINPLATEYVDVATPQSQVMLFLSVMPYLLIMVIFNGGAHIIIDSTAGEKERGSLEPLLINPVRRAEFVIAKMLASVPFATFAVFVNLAAFGLAFNLTPLEKYLGFQLTLDLGALLAIFFLSLPLILLAASLQMIIATFTRRVKEAQTYLGFLAIVPALPGIGLAFMPVKASIINMLTPVFGQQIMINQFMRGEFVSPANILISSVSTLIAALLFTFVAIMLFKRERIIFGAR
jgi:sodium transport system permease protein